MKVKIDFQLNRQFGVVERIIFRLVLNGFTDAKEIAEALPVFSDTVIANGIKTLINRQILSAKTKAGTLSLSEPVVAIIEMCVEKDYEISVLSEIRNELCEGGLLITSSMSEEVKDLKKTVLFEFLPGIRMDMYIDSLDFVMREEKRGGHDE